MAVLAAAFCWWMDGVIQRGFALVFVGVGCVGAPEGLRTLRFDGGGSVGWVSPVSCN